MSLLKRSEIILPYGAAMPERAFDLPNLGRVGLTPKNAELVILSEVPEHGAGRHRHVIHRDNGGTFHEILEPEVEQALTEDEAYLETSYPSWGVYLAILKSKAATYDTLDGLGSPQINLTVENGSSTTNPKLNFLNSRIIAFKDDRLLSHIEMLEPAAQQYTAKRFLQADYPEETHEMMNGQYPLTMVPKGIMLGGVETWFKGVAEFTDADASQFGTTIQKAA